jgi:pimeloyl-ACP methyl ester carboxylesterase
MSASGARTALRIIDEAEKSDLGPAAALIVQMRRSYSAELAAGMALSVIAADDVPLITSRDLDADAASGFLRGAVARGMLVATRNWPRGAAPTNVLRPLRSNVPVLLVAGETDPATPPEFARRIAATLENSRVLVFPGGAHSANNFDGLDRIMAQFIATADLTAIDTSAVTANRPVALVGD